MLTDRQAEAVYQIVRECGVGVGKEFQAYEVFSLNTVEDDDPAWALHDALEELALLGLAEKRIEREGRRTWFCLYEQSLAAYDEWAAGKGKDYWVIGSAEPGQTKALLKALFWDDLTGRSEDVVLVNPSKRALEILKGQPDFIGIAGPMFGAPNATRVDAMDTEGVCNEKR